MRINAISHHTNQHFVGENKKSNALKNATGAAAIAMLTAVPTNDADAQIYYPPILYYPPVNYTYTPTTPVSIPNCFVVGDTKYSDYDKSARNVFEEIDANGNNDGTISAKEVIRTERQNWNRSSLTPFSTAQMHRAEQQFKTISRLYNEDNSNPNTMNYQEYKESLKDYAETKQAIQVQSIINLLTNPYWYSPIFPPPRPHYHNHHNHHHHHDRHHHRH